MCWNFVLIISTISIMMDAEKSYTLIHCFLVQGYYTTMACSKHGSRVLEALWKVATIKAKTQVCNELVADELKLKDNLFGRIIFNNFQVCNKIRYENKIIAKRWFLVIKHTPMYPYKYTPSGWEELGASPNIAHQVIGYTNGAHGEGLFLNGLLGLPVPLHIWWRLYHSMYMNWSTYRIRYVGTSSNSNQVQVITHLFTTALHSSQSCTIILPSSMDIFLFLKAFFLFNINLSIVWVHTHLMFHLKDGRQDI